MIEIDFVFPSLARKEVITAIMGLPETYRPTHICNDKEKAGRPIEDSGRFIREFSSRQTGELLIGRRGTIDISLAGPKPINCNLLLDVSPDEAEEVVDYLCIAKPVFGFACASEERLHRNRTTNVLGVNTIESWVGRDTEKYIPGLYWITVLSDEILHLHKVPLANLAEAADRQTEPAEGIHVLRFYEDPRGWHNSDKLTTVIESVEGIFKIAKARDAMGKASNFLEHSSIYRNWK